MLFFLSPTVGWGLPLLWPIVLAAAGAMGYRKLTEEESPETRKITQQMHNMRMVRIPLDVTTRQAVEDEVAREEVIRFAKDDIVLVFKRDLRGQFVVEVIAPLTYNTSHLQTLGLDFAAQVAQKFAYNRMVSELDRRGATVVEEEVNDQGDIVLKLRRWE